MVNHRILARVQTQKYRLLQLAYTYKTYGNAKSILIKLVYTCAFSLLIGGSWRVVLISDVGYLVYKSQCCTAEHVAQCLVNGCFSLGGSVAFLTQLSHLVPELVGVGVPTNQSGSFAQGCCGHR